MKTTELAKIRKKSEDKRTYEEKRALEIVRELYPHFPKDALIVQAKFDFKSKILYLTDDLSEMVYRTTSDILLRYDEDDVDEILYEETFRVDEFYCDFDEKEYETLKTLLNIFPNMREIVVYHPYMKEAKSLCDGKYFTSDFDEFAYYELSEKDAFIYFLINRKQISDLSALKVDGWKIGFGSPKIKISSIGEDYMDEIRNALGGGNYLRFFNFNPKDSHAYVSTVWYNPDKCFLWLKNHTREYKIIGVEDTSLKTIKAIKSFYPSVKKVCAIIPIDEIEYPAQKEDIENMKWEEIDKWPNGNPIYECEVSFIVALDTLDEVKLHTSPDSEFPWLIEETVIDGVKFSDGN